MKFLCVDEICCNCSTRACCCCKTNYHCETYRLKEIPCQTKTKDASVINGYQHFVVVAIQPSITNVAIKVLEVNLIPATNGNIHDINIAQNEV